MSPEQIIVLGLIASALTFGLRALATYGGVRVGRIVVNIVLFVVSAGLAIAWAGASFPAFPSWEGDILAFATALWGFLNALVALGAPILGTATLIYNFLYERVVVPLWARFAKA